MRTFPLLAGFFGYYANDTLPFDSSGVQVYTSADPNVRYSALLCHPCPSGADCTRPAAICSRCRTSLDSDAPGTIEGTLWASIETLPGYWRSSNDSFSFYQCLVPSVCAASTCTAHKTGVLCNLCEPGYHVRAD